MHRLRRYSVLDRTSKDFPPRDSIKAATNAARQLFRSVTGGHTAAAAAALRMDSSLRNRSSIRPASPGAELKQQQWRPSHMLGPLERNGTRSRITDLAPRPVLRRHSVDQSTSTTCVRRTSCCSNSPGNVSRALPEAVYKHGALAHSPARRPSLAAPASSDVTAAAAAAASCSASAEGRPCYFAYHDRGTDAAEPTFIGDYEDDFE